MTRKTLSIISVFVAVAIAAAVCLLVFSGKTPETETGAEKSGETGTLNESEIESKHQKEGYVIYEENGTSVTMGIEEARSKYGIELGFETGVPTLGTDSGKTAGKSETPENNKNNNKKNDAEREQKESAPKKTEAPELHPEKPWSMTYEEFQYFDEYYPLEIVNDYIDLCDATVDEKINAYIDYCNREYRNTETDSKGKKRQFANWYIAAKAEYDTEHPTEAPTILHDGETINLDDAKK